jgi:hypothetical protein
VTGLAGVNCRHSYFPWFAGISKAAYDKAELESYANKTVTYNGKKMTVYEATQEQRAIERQIRSFKRQENALQAGGLDASSEAAKVRDLQAKMRSFTKQTGLSRQGVREQVVVKELKTMSAPKNANANYLPEVVSFPNPSQGQRSPTSAELITFTDRVKSMPVKIRALEPTAPSMREITRLDGTKKVLVDQVEFNVIQDISKSDLGSAYNRGKALSISDEFIGTPIQDHEYLHTLTYRNHTLRDALQEGKYHPPELFEHAQFAQNKLGEQFTMVMTGYSDDIAKWENDIARLCYFDNPDNLNRAKSQIKAVTEFLKGIGLW